MPDPAEVEGSDDSEAARHSGIPGEFGRRIDLLLALPIEKLERLALEREVRGIGGK